MYKMPKPAIGAALWSAHPGEPQYPAIITEVGGGSVEMTVFFTDSRTAQPRSAVRHIQDPQFPTMLERSGGVWDFTDDTKRLRAIEDRLDSLEQSLI